MADAPLLGPIIEISALLVALACIALLAYIVKALLDNLAALFSIVPFIGGVTASAIHSMEQAISHALGVAISGIEGAIGQSWHLLSRALGSLWAEQKLIAENLWKIAQELYHFGTVSDIRHWLRDLSRAITHANTVITNDLRRELHNARWLIRHTIRTIAPRVRALEHAIDTTIPREFGHLWGQTKALEDSIGRLWKRVRELEASVGAGAIAAIVATAIAALGLDWLKCSDGANRAGRSGCDLWDGIGDVFGLLAAVELAANFETFVHDAQAATEATVSAVKDFSGLG